MKTLLSKLNVETFILDLVEPCSSFPEDMDITIRPIDSLTLEVDLKRGQYINTLFQHLSKQNIHVRSMRNKTNRLEELFIRLLSNEHQ